MSTKPDQLQKLPPEIRVDIFKYALSTSEWLRRPYDGEACYPVDLLQVNRQSYTEIIDYLYHNHIFCLRPVDIREFGNLRNFCAIKRIVIFNDSSEPLQGRPMTLALNLRLQIIVNASRPPPRALKLKSLVIPTDGFRRISDTLQSAHIVNIGSWKLLFGQNFDMDLVNCELRDIWSHVQAQPPETTIQDLAQAYIEWELHHKENGRLQRKLLLHAIVLAIDSDTLINNPMT